MAENLTTTTQVSAAVGVWYDKVLLKRALPHLVHDKFAQRRPLPSKSGDTIKFRRYSSLSLATTPLSEGVTPPGQQLSKTDLLASVSQYGDYVHITDWVDLTVEDAVLTEANALLGEQTGQTLDRLLRDTLTACASIYSCAKGSNGKTPTELSQTDIDACVKVLLGGNTQMFTKVITATAGQGTAPIRPAFWGVIHSDLLDALEACTNFKATAEYPSQGPVMEAEWGATKNVRWLWTTFGHKDTSTSPDNYKSPIIGQNAYGITEISGGALRSIVKAFGSGGTADPLNQRCTAGWKLTFVARILNDAFMLLLKSTNKLGSG